MPPRARPADKRDKAKDFLHRPNSVRRHRDKTLQFSPRRPGRPKSRRRSNEVGWIIIVAGVSGGSLANDIVGKQTLDIGKACEIAQMISPFSGSAVSRNTSAHDDTRLRFAPSPRLEALF